MRNRVFFMMLAAFSLLSCSSPERYVRRAVRIMDKQGLYAEGPQWDSAKSAILSVPPLDMEQAYSLTKEALKVAGGKHSFIQSAESVQADAVSEARLPEVTVSEEGIAMISIPPFTSNEAQGLLYARAVLDAVPDNIKGAVIDLRGNTGGNMYPMIAALHRFIPESEDMLRFRGRKRTNWIPRSFVLDIVGLEPMARIECPLAILTDGMTASSGEAVLICFRGLDNVKTFGAPTAGYASSNALFSMPDGSRLLLTVSCDVARTGEVFCEDPIAPDFLTESPLEDALAYLRGM